MASPVVPKYLAVWVQGPGLLWIDDLSLREVIPPPLRVRLDQDRYDSRDRAGIATATVWAQAAPARVRFTLSRAGGPPWRVQLAAPFQAQVDVASDTRAGLRPGRAGSVAARIVAPVTLRRTRFVFNPSALAPGRYEVKAELLDAAGAAFAAKTVTLRRDPD